MMVDVTSQAFPFQSDSLYISNKGAGHVLLMLVTSVLTLLEDIKYQC